MVVPRAKESEAKGATLWRKKSTSLQIMLTLLLKPSWSALWPLPHPEKLARFERANLWLVAAEGDARGAASVRQPEISGFFSGAG